MTYEDWKKVYIDRTLSLKDWQYKRGRAIINPPTKYSFGQKINSNIKVYGGVECRVTYTKEKFYEETFERDCIVYTTKDGTKFFFPKDLNVDFQTMTPKMAISVWSELPESLRAMSQKRIAFLDIYNPDDDYWVTTKGYKNFNCSYATSGQEIIFWRYEGIHQEYNVKHTYCHEIAHFVDKKLGNVSSSSEWQKAMALDETTSGEKYVTEYGENSPEEDFADSVAEYFLNGDVFSVKFPARTKLLRGLLKYG